MKWRGQKQSTNVEDLRGRGRGSWAGRGAGLGCGGLILVVLFALMTGQDPLQLLQSVQQTGGTASLSPPATSGGPLSDDVGQFTSVVLASTEEVWTGIFRAAGHRYEPPVLTLFSGAVQSACGMGNAAVGPFYCPRDQRVYLDTEFFDTLAREFGAPGDFAAAYVIAHEVGHHVQNLLGIAAHVQEAQQRAWNEAQANELSVALELQADCLAGVWANHARHLLEEGDIEEGLRAAAAIGDDRIQRRTQGTVVPESWTHGSSEQRAAWLRRGLESGNADSCETIRR